MSKISIRKATQEDSKFIFTLLKSVDLPTDGVKEHIKDFLILLDKSNIIGSVGIECYGKKALLRSLAVHPSYQKNGYGNLLYEKILSEVKKKNIGEIYLLTESAENFFERQGFKTISRSEVDEIVKESVEFKYVCPESCTCMNLKL